MRRIALVCFALVVALAEGCAVPVPVTETTATRAPTARAQASAQIEQLAIEEPIDVRVRRYVNDVRFRLFDSAVGFVEPDLRPQFRAATDYLQTIRFTGVTIEEVDVDETGNAAVATVRWRGHWLQSPFERQLRTTQRWRRDASSNTWYVTPELEALGANLDQLRRAPAASMPPR
jgi:hypothetical protein